MYMRKGLLVKSKRIFDFVVSLLLLVLLSPGILLISLMIKGLMPGPVFFIHRRIGKNGKEFRLIKFRTMTPDPEKSSGCFDAGDTSRVTPLGRLLRRTKTDEIPQLINVIKGDMSLVGPRPEVKKWTEVYPEKWVIVHYVKPGITDNASIIYRNEETILASCPDPERVYRDEILPNKLNLYIDYVNHHTFFGDVMIILRTVKEVLTK